MKKEFKNKADMGHAKVKGSASRWSDETDVDSKFELLVLR